MNRILIVTAVAVEKKAILQGLNSHNQVDVLVIGVGPVAAAINTLQALMNKKYDLVICAGVAGGFSHHANLGTLVVADEIIAADLGVESPNGFSSLDELGFGQTRFRSNPTIVKQVVNALHRSNIAAVVGPVLTVSTVTGTDSTTNELLDRFPRAVAEAMEGFGVATAATSYEIPFIEIRTISNIVGPRDRDNWQIKEALDVLSNSISVLLKNL